MKQYEALFIINVGKEKVLKEVTDVIAGTIKKNDGNVENDETWGRQTLPYLIKKEREGIYYRLLFSAEPSKIATIDKNYKLNSDILRVMITVK